MSHKLHLATKTMNSPEKRGGISKILVKWNMPTRQAAIGEIISLLEEDFHKMHEKHTEHHIKLREKALSSQKEEFKKVVEGMKILGTSAQFGTTRMEGFNQALSDILKAIEEL